MRNLHKALIASAGYQYGPLFARVMVPVRSYGFMKKGLIRHEF